MTELVYLIAIAALSFLAGYLLGRWKRKRAKPEIENETNGYDAGYKNGFTDGDAHRTGCVNGHNNLRDRLLLRTQDTEIEGELWSLIEEYEREKGYR